MTIQKESTTLTGMQTPSINKDIFKAYDIRGEIGKDWCLNDNYHDAFLIGQALGRHLVSQDSKHIIVGRDGRNSSEQLTQSLVLGLISAGCHVTDIGLVATPIVYFCLDELSIPNCVMVTGSHNPPSHNGIKMVTNRIATSEQLIESLYFDIVNHRDNSQYNAPEQGRYTLYEQSIPTYNGATGLFSEALFTQLGCEVHPLFCDVDGNFPNHSPDPTTPKNLQSLITLVKDNHLDVGIAFDGDGDRMIAVDNHGNILWPDRILILLLRAVLASQANSRIVFDIKCSMLLPAEIRKAGGQAAFCRNGHSIMKREVKRLDAVIGGEFSGHIVMRDRWNDFDDAPYVAARFLEILSESTKTCSEIFQAIPDSFSTEEYKIKAENIHKAAELVADFIQNAEFKGAHLRSHQTTI